MSNFSDLVLHRFIQRFAHIEHHVSDNYAFERKFFSWKAKVVEFDPNPMIFSSIACAIYGSGIHLIDNLLKTL